MEHIEVEPFETIFDILELLISKYGAMGIAAAMFAESAGVPFASAIVFLTAGTMILRGTVSFWSIFAASTLGITFGSIFSYTIGLVGSMVGRAVRTGLFHHYFARQAAGSSKPRSKLMKLWDKYGSFSIFMAQLWGFSRTFISFPAGAMHMNIYLFILYTFLGGAIFSLVAIGSSILLTGTMTLIFRLLRLLHGLSPWLLGIPVLLACAAVYLFRARGWKIRFSFLASLAEKLSRGLKRE